MKNIRKKKTFVSWFVAIFAIAFLGIVAMMGHVSLVYAANITTHGVAGLTASYDKGTWSASEGRINGSVKTTSSSGCNGTTYSPVEATLTLTNNSGSSKALSYSLSVIPNGGTCSDSEGNYSIQLTNGEAKTITIKSSSSAENETSIVLSNIKLEAPQNVRITFNVADHGSYTVDGAAISTATEIEKTQTDSFACVATPASGYKFYGWYDYTHDEYVSNNASDNLTFASSATIYPVFVSASTPIFKAKNAHIDLNEAVTDAVNNSIDTIVLVSDGILPSGNYSIPSGKTLLIPFNDSYTKYESTPETTDATTTPSAFRTLSISHGVTIDCYGKLNLSSKVYQGDGRTVGKYGAIKFLDISGSQQESVINMKSGSNLYCWGYIWGNSGQIIAESDSTLYEPFQLAGWRGGTATSGMNGNSSKVFPVNQYFIQNIEVYTKIFYGAKEKLFTATTMSLVGTSQIPVDFIGTTSGMFRLSQDSYVTKKYDPIKDSLVVEAFGRVTLSSIILKVKLSIVGTVTMNSSDYVLPISSSMDITILNSGNSNSPSQVITNQDLAFLPGSKLTIEQNAMLSIQNNNSIYVYDYDEWGGKGYAYAGNSHYPMINTSDAARVLYSPNTGRVPRTSVSDAEIDINGSINVASGAGIYTTNGGAHIHSSGMTGNIVFSNGPGTKTQTYQAKQSGSDITYDTIPVTNAKLHNGEQYYGTDDEYYLTDEVEPGYNVTYDDINDKWGEKEAEKETIHVSFRDKGDGSNQYDTSYQYPGDPFYFPTQSQANFTNQNNYKIRKWYSEDQDNRADLIFSPGEEFDGKLEDNTTFYSYYGGWMTDKNSTISYTYKTSADTPTYPSGLTEVENMNGEGTGLYYFEGNGILCIDERIVYYNVDGSYYYVIDGTVQKDVGAVIVDTDDDSVPDSLYYIDQDGKALVSQIAFLSTKLNGLLEPGYYEIAADGKILTHGTPHHITNNLVYDSDNNLTLSYGLFCLSNEDPKYLYYCKDDGSLVKNQTFYVSKTNSCWIKYNSEDAIYIEEGLYYFDSDGHMWYGNSILENTSFEYGLIVSGNGVFIGMGGN